VLISENFDITYGLGNLTIVPATLTVRAKDSAISCAGIQPVYSSINSIYQYDDVDTSVIASGPTFTVLNGPKYKCWYWPSCGWYLSDSAF